MERVMSELAEYFCSKSKYEVHLILYGISREMFYAVPDTVIVHSPSFEFDNTRRFYNTIKTLWFVRTTIKAIHPDTVLSFGERWNNFVLLATLYLKYPMYVSDRCQPDKSLGKLHDTLRHWLYPKTDGVICQTEKAKTIYQRMFNHANFVVIGNPIRKIKPEASIPKENIVLSVGRLIESKHHDELISIFSEINALDWKLIIVGGEALKQNNKERLERLIQDLGMQGSIELAGKRLDVEHFYNRAKLFALTSSSEGFPNVIGEAMSAGLPVVAYDCIAGPSDLIDHGNTGFLVALHDRATFKSQLELLMNDQILREQMSRNAQKQITQFSVAPIAQQFEKTLFSAYTSN